MKYPKRQKPTTGVLHFEFDTNFRVQPEISLGKKNFGCVVLLFELYTLFRALTNLLKTILKRSIPVNM